MVRKAAVGIVLLVAGCHSAPAFTSFTGQVIDEQGRPVANAAIALPHTTLLTDEQGRFSVPATGPVTATVAATGYQSATRMLTPSAPLLTLSPRLIRRLVIDLSHQPLGGDSQSFVPLAQAWLEEGVQVDLPERFPDLADVETLLIAAPKLPYSNTQLDAIQRFVGGGGKLVLLGEWGGFGGYDPIALDQLSIPFGIRFRHDLIRGPRGSVVEIQSWRDHPLTRRLRRIHLYGATSLEVEAPATAIGFADGYRIAQAERPAVVAVALFGAGRVIAIGDCSLFTHVTDGTMPALEADNRPFAQSILTW